MAAELTRLLARLPETATLRRVSRQLGGFRDKAAARATAALIPRAETTAPIAFDVVGGLHSGARAQLDARVATIGSNTESDIVLIDDGVVADHARLLFRHDRVDIEAIGGPVRLANGDLVPHGQGRRCKLPIELALGNARVRLANPAGITVDAKPSNRPIMVAAGLFVAVFALSIASNTLSRAAPDTNEQRADTGGVFALAGTAPPQATLASRTGSSAVEQARGELEGQLQQVGIGGLGIDVADDRIVVSGTIPRAQSAAWTAAQSWFDRTHGQKILLVSNVMVGDSNTVAPRLALQAIWYGERPYIITADGARYHEGSFVNGGWIIEEIGEQKLVLSKDNSTIALNYR